MQAQLEQTCVKNYVVTDLLGGGGGGDTKVKIRLQGRSRL